MKMPKYLLLLLCACLLASCDQQVPESPPEPEGGEVQWIDPGQIQPGPIRHETLPDEIVERIKVVQTVFAEVDPTPLEEWIENFKRDMNPDRELVIWEAMAAAYTSYNADRDMSLDKRKELFRILLIRSMSSTKDALTHLELKTFTEDEAREAMGFLATEWEQRNSTGKPSVPE